MKKKRKFATPEPKLLFVAASSQDDKGRRVLVRDPAGSENWIWPENDMDVSLLGISESQTKQIKAFFTGTGHSTHAHGG